jgi:cell division protein FtsI/penicillin-binding protein 2
VGPPGAGRAAGQRDPARGAVRDQARAHPVALARARRNKESKVGGRTFYFRRYPQGRLAAHVVGYSTAARSRTGLERSLNPALTGSARSLSSLVDQSLDKLNGRPIVGDTVVTTLDVNGQRAALDALGSTCGRSSRSIRARAACA